MRPQLQRNADRKRTIVGFVAGAIGVLTVHQALLWILHRVGFAPWPAYRLAPTRPFGIPYMLSAAFWGGLWGIVIFRVSAAQRTEGRAVVVAILIAALLPTLAGAVLVVLHVGSISSTDLGTTPKVQALVASLIVNGGWGASVQLIGAALTRRFAGRERDQA